MKQEEGKPKRPFFISAITTPLHADESLHVEALEAHLEDQWQAGINGVLVAGTMGLMQLLTDQTYRQLVEHATRFSAGRGEVMVGVGDTSLTRTRQRIELLNSFDVDCVVVLTPYFILFKPEELVDYYLALADASRHPLYLYDLPVLTGMKLDIETVERVAQHPKIHGIKASCEIDWIRELIRRIGGRFRVITAQPTLVDVLLREGITEHLDGMFAIAPGWTVEIGRAAEAGDWQRAAAYQQRMSQLLALMRRLGVAPAVTVIFNARGIPGNYAPAPMRLLDAGQQKQLLAEPIVRELINGEVQGDVASRRCSS